MSYQLIRFIEKFSSVHLLVIGDIMLDRFMTGTVDRISPEAPVPIFKQRSEKLMLGGAGNVVANLTALGCQPHFVGVIGKDAQGELVSSYLKQLKASSYLLKTKQFPTITKTRMIANNNHLLRCDQEMYIQLTEQEEKSLLSYIEKQLPNMDLVLLSDYGKGLFTPPFTQAIIQLCHQNKKTVFIDPKGADYSKYRGATLIKPNRKELELATALSLPTDAPDFIEQVQIAAHKMLDMADIQQTIVTLSEKGMIFVSQNPAEEPIHLETFAREVFDVSGAGDTSLSVLGLAMAAGATIGQTMELANLASGIVVGKIGTATTSPEELKTAVQTKYQLDRPLSTSKLVSMETAIGAVKQMRKQGKVIGFSSGCFDILTLGQLKALQQAKKSCDFLIVGINTDESITHLHGEKPIQDEQTRSQLIAALECVDLVVLFNGSKSTNNALDLVQLLKPDVITKAGYNLGNWPEAQYVSTYGGTILELQESK